jgi:hypothetical protein
LHLNEPAKQICLNIYNNLLKEKEADSEAGAMSETVLKLAARLTGIPYTTMVKLVREGIVKRRLDAGKSIKLNPAMAKLLGDTVYEDYKRNEIPTIETINKKIFEINFDLTGDKEMVKKNLGLNSRPLTSERQ